MKWFGLIKDDKDLTTKEYVDSADTELKESADKRLKNLEEKKVNATDLSNFTGEEVLELWNSIVK